VRAVADALVIARDLVKEFPTRGGFGARGARVHAVSGVSLEVAAGETLGIVGESGCGKSTLGRMLLHLVRPTAGTVEFEGRELGALSGRELRALRPRFQIVFQDPFSALNPRLTAGEAIAEPLRVHRGMRGRALQSRVRELLSMVGLAGADAGRFPQSFSGGQRQRIGVARALALEPAFVLLDEPVSALDVSIRAGIVNLLRDLQSRLGVAYVFIAHDLSLVRHISDRVAVMYLGKIVETGTRDDVFARPQHPYTRALLSAVPETNPRAERERQRIVLRGEVPSPLDPPSGCGFRTRCWKAADRCAIEEPALVDRGGGHPVACHFPE
jgi:peptide/nickel transport system ATP-binding protein/oligopeptide transport system ATP-binding protein